jgi:hypothetical protein
VQKHPFKAFYIFSLYFIPLTIKTPKKPLKRLKNKYRQYIPVLYNKIVLKGLYIIKKAFAGVAGVQDAKNKRLKNQALFLLFYS